MKKIKLIIIAFVFLLIGITNVNAGEAVPARNLYLLLGDTFGNGWDDSYVTVLYRGTDRPSERYTLEAADGNSQLYTISIPLGQVVEIFFEGYGFVRECSFKLGYDQTFTDPNQLLVDRPTNSLGIGGNGVIVRFTVLGETYSITEIPTTGGNYSVDTSAANGATVGITNIIPDDGYRLKAVKILKASDNSDVTEEVRYNEEDYSFMMPDYEVKIDIEFELIPPTTYDIIKIESNGTFSIDKTTSESGDIITISNIVPEEGYTLKSIKILKARDGSDVTEEVGYNEANKTFTMPDYDINIQVDFELLYEEKTLTVALADITVTVKGNFNGNPELVVTKIEEDNEGYNSLITLVNEEKIVICSYDVSITGGTYEGKLYITFTVGEQYDGETFTIYHKLVNGEVETKTAVVDNGKVEFEIDELSPFMLIADKKAQENKDETPKTGNSIEQYTLLFVIGLVGTISTIVIRKK